MIKVLFILISFIGLSYSIPHGIDYDKCHKELREHKSKFNLHDLSENQTIALSLNYMKMTEHNSNKSRTYTQGLNAFSHLTWDEFKIRLGYNPEARNAKSNGTSYSWINRIPVPEFIDWRTEGMVSRVKDQGQCGSCWAFSAVGALEGQTKRITGRMIELSEQNLVDCSTSESDCNFHPEYIGATDSGYADVEPENEDDLKEAVAVIGPISVAIEATENFMRYDSGVFYDEDCKGQVNHGVLLVGYGTDAEQGDYWIVKNSWGPRWGEDGYIRMARNRDNNCGILNNASFPMVWEIL